MLRLDPSDPDAGIHLRGLSGARSRVYLPSSARESDFFLFAVVPPRLTRIDEGKQLVVFILSFAAESVLVYPKINHFPQIGYLPRTAISPSGKPPQTGQTRALRPFVQPAGLLPAAEEEQ